MAPSIKSSIFSILHITQWVAHVHQSLFRLHVAYRSRSLLKSQFTKSTSWSVVNSACCFCSTFKARWFLLTARPWWCTPALITALERWRLSRGSEFKLSLGHKRHHLKYQYINVYSFRCSPFLIQSIDSKQSPTYPVRKLKGQEQNQEEVEPKLPGQWNEASCTKKSHRLAPPFILLVPEPYGKSQGGKA